MVSESINLLVSLMDSKFKLFITILALVICPVVLKFLAVGTNS